MKIVLSGVETNNKGAELMLYAILQEIERRFPDATVYIPTTHLRRDLKYIHTSLQLKYWPYGLAVQKLRLYGIFRRLHIPLSILEDTYAIKNADFFIDASGFHFSDQKKNFTPEKVKYWGKILKRYHNQGTKIIFLPQAFGPALKENTIKGLMCISNYSDIIMPREKVSYDYLKDSNIVDMNKVKLFTDFTSLVGGLFPQKYEKLKGGVCIIPNLRMVDSGTITLDKYICLLTAIAESCKEINRPIYLLNHEGKGDENLSYLCQKNMKGNIDVVTGLNALEVKGMIASAYLVVTSRFHGLASALNCCVPCLATSWSHKYEELLCDYKLTGLVLPLDDIEQAKNKVKSLIEKKNNDDIRHHLTTQVEIVKTQTKKMWNTIWTL